MVEVIYFHFAAFELSLNFMICLNQDDLRSHPISYKPTVFWWGAFKKQKSSSAGWQLLCWLTGVTCTKLTSLLETLAMYGHRPLIQNLYNKIYIQRKHVCLCICSVLWSQLLIYFTFTYLGNLQHLREEVKVHYSHLNTKSICFLKSPPAFLL